MFGTVLEKLSGWFGQSFLLARFFPCLVFAVANAGIAYGAFPSIRPWLRTALADAAASNMAGYLLLALGTLAVVAYTLSPFVRIAVELLEGNWMLAPGASVPSRWLGERLVAAQSERLDDLTKSETELFRNRASLPTRAAIRSRLAKALAVGEALREVPYPEIIREAKEKVDALLVLRRYRRSIAARELEDAVALVADALRLNCATPRALLASASDDDRRDADTLAGLQRTLVSVLVPYARDIAEDNESRVVDRKDQVFARAELAPTRFGNLSAALRSYCKTRYGIEFGYFWPRFLLAMQKDQTLGPAIAGANIQVEFAVVSLALTALSVALWLVLFIRFFEGPLPLFLVAALGPPAVGFWQRVMEASYKEYADIVRSAIDLGRFELLGALRQPLPPTLDGERQAWDRLARLALLNRDDSDRPIVYTGSGSAPSAKT